MALPSLRRALPVLHVLIAALMLLWTAAVSGRPALFYDDDLYYVMGRDVVSTAAHLPQLLHLTRPPVQADEDEDASDNPVAADEDIDTSIVAGRSFYYGALLFISQEAGSIWWLAAGQALLAAAVIRALWRSAAPQAPDWSYLALMGGLALASSLPFYAAFTMPDVFSGIGVAAAAALLLFWERLGPWSRAGLWGATVLSLNVHGSNPLTMAALLGAAGLGAAWMRAPRRSVLMRGGAVTAALICAVAANHLYAAAFMSRNEEPIRRAPFLAARLLADGPGRTYLRRACDQGVRYELCRFRNLPLDDSDEILWVSDPKRGVFEVTTDQGRVALEREEGRFVRETIAHDPGGVVLAALLDWAKQLWRFQVIEPLKDQGWYLRAPYWPSTHIPQLIVNVRDCAPPNSGCPSPFSRTWLKLWHGAALLAALGFFGWWCRRTGALAAASRRRPDEVTRLAALFAFVLAAAVINAAVCGMISGPFARYQARIVWLLPLAAGVIACGWLSPEAWRAAEAWVAGNLRRLRPR